MNAIGRASLWTVLLAAAAAALALGHSAEIRSRAELALGEGMPAREAALARGFVLGEDDRVDARTGEDFRRAGLSHLLAVSGQNVALLALLAMPVLAALAMPLRTRLIWVLGLIAVYVPLAGAGPSIQRAGIMGGLSVLAMLRGRRASRLYALGFAALVLLLLEPAIAADVGWQLSFAAVLGILLLAAPLRMAITAWLGAGGWRRALADGAAMTTAATLATAPLIAFHFEAISTTTLVANLLALPAVAPAMWLGMVASAAGQVPGFPVELVNAINAPLLAYIAQVAAWCGRPSWAYLHLRLGPAGVVASYVAIALSALLARHFARRRRLAALRRGRPGSPPGSTLLSSLTGRWRSGAWTRSLALAAMLAPAALVLLLPSAGGAPHLAPPAGLRISVLDVGQGDAILLQPRDAPAVLVDSGPPGSGLEADLRAAGAERLGAIVVTHDQSDHAGGLRELLGGRLPIERFLYAGLGRRTLADVATAGIQASRLVKGDVVRAGSLRLEVLWPPPELLATSPRDQDPNRLGLVMLARWHRFSMLLTADAEAEGTPIDSGPIDVLKVAHHGSDDAGLAVLLDRTHPRLALISVGAANPFGHPTPTTLATLAAHRIPIRRTDRDGTIKLEIRRGSVEIDTGE